MSNLQQTIRLLIELREREGLQLTLLAVCPNSAAVLEAAVKVAARCHTPMLFAATLNQVDRDGGYTGWTPAQFVAEMKRYAVRYGCTAPLYPCLDHGGPWLKDRHTLEKLPLPQAMHEVKLSLSACLEAGYALLHIDPTVDRTLPAGEAPPVPVVVERTVELIEHAEQERRRLNLPPVAYEVGTEEVHGGLVNFDNFVAFLDLLKVALERRSLLHAWPAFVVAQVGTDLHTTYFDPVAAQRLTEIVRPTGALLKGHYTDWVENPADYPRVGMGGANVGPEFTAVEFEAVEMLERREQRLCANRKLQPACFLAALEEAVVASNRWQKWLQPDELGKPFAELTPARRRWLVQTGARYVWTAPKVLAAREQLYAHLALVQADPHAYVVESIARSIERYVDAFNLYDAATLLT
ncbi:MAG: class II D-tagatose-bisphosphate aldolase, non-catalytic subunit [Caldilinea sp.]|nr:class II D-tagatose-bisphosphate aldolase, non-catalytic subunit [Caldilinea sp.]MDW8442470.1 class II D-tagatose-bisphosphate aldolase, non-catalytic subunit [Caldilineaceae bacterium]